MSPGTYATSPSARGTQRKFINPTRGYVGANVFGPDGKPTAIAVEPGGEVWLTEEEERMTAEAPRHALDNPFVKEWDEPVDFDTFGEPTRTVKRQGTLVLAEDPPRPIASQRHIPPREEDPQAYAHWKNSDGSTSSAPLSRDGEPVRMSEIERAHEPEPEVTGTDELPQQPPVEGQPSPDEVIGTPEAPERNAEALAAREPTAEQPTITTEEEGGLPV